MSEDTFDYYNDDFMDPYTEALGEFLDRRDREMNAISNPKRIIDIKDTKDGLVELLRGTGARISCKVNEPFKNIGYISVNSAELNFSNPHALFEIMDPVDNIVIYPKTDGTIVFELTFQNVATYF